MPAWLVKIIQALAIPVLNWAGDFFREWIESRKLKRQERKKNEKQKIRDSLTRQLELAKDERDEKKIREISIALLMLGDD